MQVTPAQQGTSTHTARPAQVLIGEHRNQRRFGPSELAAFNLKLESDGGKCTAQVYRDSADDVAELSLRLGLWTEARFTARLTPTEPRELAARLLDAAHDIETLPAAVLARAKQDGAA